MLARPLAHHEKRKASQGTFVKEASALLVQNRNLILYTWQHSTMWLQMIHRHNGICFCFTVLHIKWSHQDTMDCALWPKTNPQSFTFCHPVLYSSQRVSIDKRESEEPTGRALLTKGRHTYITKWQDAVFARLAFFCISGVCKYISML